MEVLPDRKDYRTTFKVDLTKDELDNAVDIFKYLMEDKIVEANNRMDNTSDNFLLSYKEVKTLESVYKLFKIVFQIED